PLSRLRRAPVRRRAHRSRVVAEPSLGYGFCPMPPQVVVAADPDALARAGADRVRAAAGAAAERGARFRLALAGGSPPRALYRLLAAAGRGIDWARTDLFFGDERCVPPDPPESNYRMARETLLEPAAVPAANVHRMAGEATDLDAAARAYEAALTD